VTRIPVDRKNSLSERLMNPPLIKANSCPSEPFYYIGKPTIRTEKEVQVAKQILNNMRTIYPNTSINNQNKNPNEDECSFASNLKTANKLKGKLKKKQTRRKLY